MTVTTPGHAYLLGVGPGAPDLLTLRAARILEDCDVIIAPRSERADHSLALKAVQAHIHDQQVLEQVYPMTREDESTRTFWTGIAGEMAGLCKQGKSVAQITIGDPMLYSTSYYLFAGLRERMPLDSIHITPGISAFQAGAARLRTMLTIQEDRMMLMPATDLTAVERALDECETLVLYKAGQVLDDLRERLRARGLLGNASVVLYAEQEGRESLIENWEEQTPPSGYMATVIIRLGRKEWS